MKRTAAQNRRWVVGASCLTAAALYTTNARASTFVPTYTTTATPSQPIYSSYGSGVVEITESGGTAYQSWINNETLTGAISTNYGGAFDSSGNYYAAAYATGSPSYVYAFPNGAATNSPANIATTPNNTGLAYSPVTGNLYVACYNTGTIVELTTSGVTVATGSVPGGTLWGIAVDSSGNVYVANSATNDVAKLTSSLSLVSATWATGFSTPHQIAFNSLGTLYVANNGNNTVSDVGSSGGAATTFATGLTGANGLAIDSNNDVFVSDAVTNNGSDYDIQQISNGTTAITPETLFDSGFPGSSSSNGNNYRFFEFAPVPEPATAAIGAVAVVGLLSRRRGKRRP